MNTLLDTASSTSTNSEFHFNLTSIYISLIVIVITFLLLWVIKKYLIKKVAYTNRDEQHKNTLIGVVFNILQYIIVILALIIILKVNGYNITSIVAGLGIVATIVGLALQDSLKDIISGINIYNNNFYKVGDVVKYNGMDCEVKYFSARVTKFRKLADDSTFTVCNSLINSIEKIKRDKAIVICFDFETDSNKIAEAFNNTCKRAEPLYGISNVEYWGLFDIDTIGLKYGLGYRCNPKDLGAKGKILTILYDELKKAGIRPSFEDEFKVKKD